MKLVLYLDDGKKQVFNNVTDLYIAVRQEEPRTDGTAIAVLPVTTSHSWGTNVRELVKEVQQSLFELQDYLRGLRNGNRS